MPATAMAANDPTLHNSNAGIYDTGSTWINPTIPTTPYQWWQYPPVYYYPAHFTPPGKCPGCGRCNICGKKEDE